MPAEQGYKAAPMIEAVTFGAPPDEQPLDIGGGLTSVAVEVDIADARCLGRSLYEDSLAKDSPCTPWDHLSADRKAELTLAARKFAARIVAWERGRIEARSRPQNVGVDYGPMPTRR